LPSSAELCLDLQSDLPPITADASEIRQMVSNLVTNAAEALGGGGGSVLVRTTVEPCDRAMLARSVLGEELAPGSYVVLEVSDSGSGMTPDTVSRIFDPFFSTKFTGRGLGLAAVAGIVRTNGGAILIDSELGRGTRCGCCCRSAASRSGADPGRTARFRYGEHPHRHGGRR
jgi:signal transduction histidine kinase